MSIQNLLSTQPKTEPRASAAGRSRPAGTSFQDQLNAAAVQAEAPDAGRAALAKDSLLSSLFALKTTVLNRMKLSKEKTEETQEWETLVEYLDAWIESLQEGKADVQKSARAYAALQDELTKDNSGRKDLGDYLLEQLEQSLAL